MKKNLKSLVTTITFVIVIVIIGLVVGGKIRNNSTEELKAQVTELKDQNVKLMKQIAELQNRVTFIEQSEEIVTVVGSAEDEESMAGDSREEVLQKILSNDVKAVDYYSALDVANSKYATEQMLLEITKNFLMEVSQLNSRSSAQNLASKITENPKVTLQVLDVMADSQLQEVRKEALKKIEKMMGGNQ